ncbi:unknown [Faecalibacterium sp. CAG:1138]|nr:unknown [Faecalibacterium sp. CAG:1138]
MKTIKNLIITFFVIVAIVGVTVIGGYVYVRTTHGIDLFRTAEQLKTLSKDVDESALCPNAYGEQDFAEMKSAVNDKIDGLIVYEKGKGYNGYSVNFASLAGKSMTDSIFLLEKHVGAIAQTVFYEQTGGKIKIGEKEVSVTVMQVDFSEIAANGSADFGVVAKLDLTPFKADMDGFPYKLLKKHIPDSLYVSSTVRVDKTEEDGFAYTVTHKSLTLNNLSADDTADLFDTLNAVLKIGTAENLNMQIGTTAVNALIGTKDNLGFAYSMKAIGAKSFGFCTISDIDLFVVY